MIDFLKHSRGEETVLTTMHNQQIVRKGSSDKQSPTLRRNSSSPRRARTSDSSGLSKSWNGRGSVGEESNILFRPHEYSKINTRTGGFESALPTQLVDYYDDTDSGSNDKARSLPPPIIARMDAQRDAHHRCQQPPVKDRVRTVQNKKQNRREGFFHRLGLTISNKKNSKTSINENTNEVSRKNRPRSLPMRMRSLTSNTSVPESGVHSNGSVFVLPDQKPGTPQTRRQRESDTDVAVVQPPHRDQHDAGFEVEFVGEDIKRKEDDVTISSWVVKLSVTDDGELLENASSPGALLLTEEGLKHHDKKTSPKNNALDKSTKSKHQLASNKSSKVIRPFGLLRRKSSETHDLANFSLAPLNTIEELQTEAASQTRSNSDPSISCQKFKIPFLKSSRSRSALEVLERERQAAEEAEAKRKSIQMMEKKEKERIERKRQEYIQRERSRESSSLNSRKTSSPLNLSAQQRESIFYSLEHSDEDLSPQKTAVTRSTMSASIEHTNTRNIPVCAACGLVERTHIAVPCMHFALCRECAFRRARKQEGCFVCQKIDVTFATVSM